MNYLINSVLKRIPPAFRVALALGGALLLTILVVYKGTQAWNGIGNFLFHRQIKAERTKVQKELSEAADQKKALEQTLLELAKAKEALAATKKEREIREQIFNDKTKTAREKVQAYEAAMQAPPIHTDPTGVTTLDLCTRAKAIGSSAATVAALCGQ